MNASPRIALTRGQILAFRQRSGGLDERRPSAPDSLRRAARAGLQDSAPRSALHSLHARVYDVGPDAWEDSSLAQVWGLRYAAFVVPAGDHAPFTLGRLPDRGPTRGVAEDLAVRLASALDGRRMDARDAGHELGVHPNSLRYAALTGTVLIRWDGARQPHVWTVPRPQIDPLAARVELARRFLHTYGVGTSAAFAQWAGVKLRAAVTAFDSLDASLVEVMTPFGGAHALASDEPMLRARLDRFAGARLLPSGDPYLLRWGAERDLLVSEPAHRAALWTPRVWPGAVLVNGEIVGTWRRSNAVATVEPWSRLSAPERQMVEAEAASLPVPGLDRSIETRWAP